jgi:hypothetical protein
MLRESQIPLVLWISAASLVHMAGGRGAVEAGTFLHDRQMILSFARQVRKQMRPQTTTVELWNDAPLGEEQIEPPPEENPETKVSDNEPDEQDLDDEQEDVVEPPRIAKHVPTPKKAEPKPEDKPEEEKKPVEAKKQEPKKPEPVKVAEAEKKPEESKPEDPQQIVLPKPDGRIAIINDESLDKNQEDNPNAPRIAEHANKTDEETMARHRSYDRNDSKPTGGGPPRYADDQEEGNATKDERGFSNEVAGNQQQAPRAGSEGGPESPPPQPIARTPNVQPQPEVEARAGQTGIKSRAGGSGEAVAEGEVIASEGAGSWINPNTDEEGDGKPKRQARRGRKAVAAQKGIPGVRMPNQGLLPRHKLSHKGLMTTLGRENLRREQERARNTRLSKHRGAFKGTNFGAYKAAIENYDPSVKPGNQTSLNAAKVAWAGYINRMHNRIHPVFADGFLGSLSGLGPGDKLSNMKLVTHVELVIDKNTGNIVRAGVTKPSGVTAFEVAAIASVKSAGPFGKPPEAIVSPDGFVYMHWEFHRDPYYACTSRFARPYILKRKPKKPGPGDPGRPPTPSGPDRRYGKNAPLRPERGR